MKLVKVTLFLLVGSMASVALSAPIAICTKGSLPKSYHGTYLSLEAKHEYVLESQRLTVNPGYFDLKSCMIDSRRFVTLTDNNPDSVQNYEVQRQGADLLFIDVSTGETGVLKFIKK